MYVCNAICYKVPEFNFDILSPLMKDYLFVYDYEKYDVDEGWN